MPHVLFLVQWFANSYEGIILEPILTMNSWFRTEVWRDSEELSVLSLQQRCRNGLISTTINHKQRPEAGTALANREPKTTRGTPDPHPHIPPGYTGSSTLDVNKRTNIQYCR